jgi:uncharacterized protein YodC (DUF2158 family)
MSDGLRRVYSPHPHRTLPDKIGQLVMLNSGGPFMLIVDVLDDGHLVCAWKQGTRTWEATFAPVTLCFVF